MGYFCNDNSSISNAIYKLIAMNKRKLIAYIIKEERWLEFESITDATIYFKNLKLSLCNIHRVLTGESTQSKGLCFAYEDSNYVEEILEKISRAIR